MANFVSAGDWRMKISITDLIKAFTLITEIIKERFGDEIEFDTDYYWTVGFPSRKDFQKSDHTLGVGSLSDDIVSLQKAISGDAVFTLVDFERFANIIMEISDIDMHEA